MACQYGTITVHTTCRAGDRGASPGLRIGSRFTSWCDDGEPHCVKSVERGGVLPAGIGEVGRHRLGRVFYPCGWGGSLAEVPPLPPLNFERSGRRGPGAARVDFARANSASGPDAVEVPIASGPRHGRRQPEGAQCRGDAANQHPSEAANPRNATSSGQVGCVGGGQGVDTSADTRLDASGVIALPGAPAEYGTSHPILRG